jgi:uncharacterized protein (DUF1501 family)
MLCPEDLTRRKFIGNACAAVGATGVLSAMAQLRMIGAVAADAASSIYSNAASDYKALVCVFLYGGNDANNVIIPTDSASYGLYASQRTALAIPQASVLPLSPRTPDAMGRSFGLHPSLVELQKMFAAGNVAFLANTGSLAYPITLAQYQTGSHLPPQLFSHADQQTQWQSSIPDKPFQTGWGGRLADMISSLNSNSQISMSVSVAGQNSFQVGKTVSQYSVSTNGAIALTGATGSAVNTSRYSAQQNLLSQTESNLFHAAFSNVTGSAITDSSLLSGVLTGTTTIATKFPNTGLGNQMAMIAKLIAAAPSLGLKRQVFFASMGGFDTHTVELATQGPLLVQVSQALSAFYNATAELGVQNQVTTFTGSDFSRTYNTNGDGADHGWGSHHIVMGGSVKGGDIYGSMPSLKLGGPDDTGRGRWIPSTSVDEYAATLATWFGVSATNLPTVLPNIGRFPTANLGFLNGT